MTRPPLLLLLTLLVACGTSAPPEGPKVVGRVIDTYPPDPSAAAWFFGKVEGMTGPPPRTEPLYLYALQANIAVGALDEQNRVRAVLPEGEFLRQSWRPLLDVLLSDNRCATNAVVSRNGVQALRVSLLSTTKVSPGVPWMVMHYVNEWKSDPENVGGSWSLSRVFVDSDVSVQGTIECPHSSDSSARLNLTLRRGWNFVYEGSAGLPYVDDYRREITTEDPAPGVPAVLGQGFTSF